MKLSSLQERQRKWVKKNFPFRASWMPLLGIFEEYGEYLSSESEEGKLDAIADMVIFLSDYCSSKRWDLDYLWNNKPIKSIYGEKDISIILGKIAHSHLKEAQKIRGNKDYHREASRNLISNLLFVLDGLSRKYDRELLKLVENTWDSVEERNWRASRGLPSHVLLFIKCIFQK